VRVNRREQGEEKILWLGTIMRIREARGWLGVHKEVSQFKKTKYLPRSSHSIHVIDRIPIGMRVQICQLCDIDIDISSSVSSRSY
jgi:hypothetical protein